MVERIVAIVMIIHMVCAHGINEKLEHMFWHNAGYQLISLSEQVIFG
jgi:hypothetical protein